MLQYLHKCQHLVYNALSDSTDWSAECLNGGILNEEQIIHHFDLASFWTYGFMVDFAFPTPILVILQLEVRIMNMTNRAPFIFVFCIDMCWKLKLCIYLIVLLMLCW
jgi:hypothetical protein